MKYRADIDGLRALAVLPVVLYHAGVPWLPGGFLGVDVFFVISGYLICGVIDGEIRNGEFSIGNFYKRRVMRIFPALFVMLLTTSVLVYLYDLPDELKDFSKSLLSAVGSVSNMYFNATAGYFDAQAETKPLLHTWSLGVEEQFYLFVPLFMLFAYKYFPQRVKIVFALIAVLSFLFEVLVYLRNPQFAFYLAPCRAWELSLGALVSIGFIRAPATSLQRNLIGGAGLALVLAAMIFGAETAPLPLVTGFASIGATLFILSSEGGLSLAGRVVSWRPIVFIGLISYSLYLWHWPIIVFQRSDSFLFHGLSGVQTRTLVIVFSFLVAWLSWKFIEAPFRAMNRQLARTPVFVVNGAVMAALTVLAGVGLVMDGAPSRFNDRIVSIASYLSYDPTEAFRSGQCYLSGNRQSYNETKCLHIEEGRRNYLLLGDSHSAMLWLGLSSALPDVNVMQASASTCRPVITSSDLFSSGFCARLMHLVFDKFLMQHRVDRLILSASWKDEDLPALANTLEILKSRGQDVVVLGPIVEYDRALPRLLADEIRYRVPDLASTRQMAVIAERDRAMRALVVGKGATYISLYQTVCPAGVCEEFANGDIPLQFDAGHLTAQGSIRVGQQLVAGGSLN